MKISSNQNSMTSYELIIEEIQAFCINKAQYLSAITQKNNFIMSLYLKNNPI